MSPGRPGPRAAVTVLVAALLLASCTATSSGPGDPPSSPTDGGRSPTEAATGPPTGSGPAARALRAGPAVAARVGAAALLEAGAGLGRGAWRDLVDPAWRDGAERPVYVVDAALDGSRLEADVVIATRAPGGGEPLVLRLLPVAEALGGDPTVATSVDGTAVETTLDAAGARLVVPLPGDRRRGGAVLLRIRLGYDVPPLEEIPDDGSPAGLGLLARSPGTVTLAHWLPALTLPGEDGPMLTWGDVAAGPAAVWSVRIRARGTVVTGGREGPCPDQNRSAISGGDRDRSAISGGDRDRSAISGGDRDRSAISRGDRDRSAISEGEPGQQASCVWARGVGLRDLSAVVLSSPAVSSERTDDHELRVLAPTDLGGVEAVLDEVVAASRSFTRRFGPLAWEQVDTVAVPLRTGAAGMELPGLSLIDTAVWSDLEGGTGSFVLAHEVAHQWFHGLVGNGSLSSPVVDESLAQYLSVLAFRDRLGDAAARDLVDRALTGRYDAALAGGLEPAPPARPADAFGGPAAYGALVYGRAPQAWIEAEEAVGVGAVRRFLAEVVRRHGLGVVSDDELVDEARTFDPALGRVLEQWWLTPAGVPGGRPG